MKTEILIWSLKAGLILSFLFAAYYLLFRNNTQFQLKRVLQIVILLAAISFPLIKISVSNDTIPTVYAFQQLNNSLTGENPVLNPSIELVPTSQIETQVSNFSKADVIWWIYLAGVSLNALIILIELTKLSYLVFKGNRELNLGENVISHSSIKYPFSFMKWIFVPTNSEYTDDDWRIIQAHENLHLNQRHTLDILFASFTQCVLWYHPAVYLIQRSMKANHEALADAAVLASTPYNQYSKTLLALSLRTNTLTLSHSFSLISSLSKRLKLMKLPKSKLRKTILSISLLSFAGAFVFISTSLNSQDTREAKRLELIENMTSWPVTMANNRLITKYEKIREVLIQENPGSKIVFTYLKDYGDVLEYTESFRPGQETLFYNELLKEEKEELYELAIQDTTADKARNMFYKTTEGSEFYFKIHELSEGIKASITNNANYILFCKSTYTDTTSFISDIYNVNEVDVAPTPVGGLENLAKSIALDIKLPENISKKDLPKSIDFEFVVEGGNSISHIKLLTEVVGNDKKQDQVYKFFGMVHNEMRDKIGSLYPWKRGIKNGKQVRVKMQIRIPTKYM
uniref:M56 family metallopeptidase n=1 Tax=Roseivirga sp. TaxID=1964215 RepID=UPI004047B482